jgi:hypothetical protein
MSKSTSKNIVVGSFKYIDDAVNAVKDLKAAGHQDIESYSPFPIHELEHALFEGKKSPVRFLTFIGGLTGLLGGFLLTIWMSVDWPLRTSAKPIISIPAFTVIGFECMVLIGAICTLLALFHFCRIPNLFWDNRFRREFSEGMVGITAKVDAAHTEQVQALLEKSGAEKVEVEYVR